MGSDSEIHDINKHTLGVLTGKCGQVKARVTRVKGFLESFNAEIHSSNLTTRLQILEKC